MKNLCRLSVGNFDISNAVCLDAIDPASPDTSSSSSEPPFQLMPAHEGMSCYRQYHISEPDEVRSLKEGRAVLAPATFVEASFGDAAWKATPDPSQKTCVAIDATKQTLELVAACEVEQNMLRPKVVMAG